MSTLPLDFSAVFCGVWAWTPVTERPQPDQTWRLSTSACPLAGVAFYILLFPLPFCSFIVMLGTEPRTSQMLGRCSTPSSTPALFFMRIHSIHIGVCMCVNSRPEVPPRLQYIILVSHCPHLRVESLAFTVLLPWCGCSWPVTSSPLSRVSLWTGRKF